MIDCKQGLNKIFFKKHKSISERERESNSESSPFCQSSKKKVHQQVIK